MRKKSSLSKFISIFIFLLIGGASGFVYLSPQFEKTAPEIEINSNGFWNLKDKIAVSLYDDSGIKSYKVFALVNGEEKVLNSKSLNTRQTDIVFNIEGLKLDKNVKNIKIIVEATDKSSWNFFQGNVSVKEISLNIDRKRPIATVITNSYNIKKGGSAIVVVKVADENLSEKFITFNDKYNFQLIPYMKENYYAAIIAWPVWEEEFDRVNLVAYDKAGNRSFTKVPLYIKDLKIKKDKIKISKNFIQNVSIPVLQKSDYEVPQDDIDVFIKENRELREENVSKIKSVSLDNMSKEMIKSFKIKPFKRLEGSKTFAGFAERREYFYEGEKIDEAWHLGMDWASYKKAPIKSSNSGKVIFDEFLGIYGNTLIIDHKLGLQSLYAHTSKFSVSKNDEVRAGMKIANTGSSGAVFGDHLHFGILVQGLEVNPVEWMDKNWIKTRITNILDEAKQVIRSSK